jgi:hypothetical protein
MITALDGVNVGGSAISKSAANVAREDSLLLTMCARGEHMGLARGLTVACKNVLAAGEMPVASCHAVAVGRQAASLISSVIWGVVLARQSRNLATSS